MLAHELSGELQEEMWIDRSRATRHSAAGDLVLKAKFVRSARAE